MFLFFIIGSVLEKPNIPILMESLSLDQKESLNRYCFCIAREFHHVAKVREAYPNIQNEFVASARKQPEEMDRLYKEARSKLQMLLEEHKQNHTSLDPLGGNASTP